MGFVAHAGTFQMMRRGALVLVVILLLLLVIIVPVGMGAAMGGMPCPDCVLSSGTATACFALVFGLAVIVSLGRARERVAATLATRASEGDPRILERPPR
jgi:hypothetical protein